MGEMNDFRYRPLRITVIVTLLGLGAIVTAAVERDWWEMTLFAVLSLYNLAVGYLEAARDFWRDRARAAEREQRPPAWPCRSLHAMGEPCTLEAGHEGAHQNGRREGLVLFWQSKTRGEHW